MKPTHELAEVVLGTRALEEDLAFFTELGFRLESIFPADAPSVAVLQGHGLRLRLEMGAEPACAHLRVYAAQAGEGRRELIAPNGTRIELVAPHAEPQLPPLVTSLAISRSSDQAAWTNGRAGMHYRDLVPDRVGGHFIISHIRIDAAGPVPDYVHFHRVRFQMIYCLRGWVKVVYEDQGEPFVMEAGDCVLQPPGIRHRVLECSAGLEVLEIGSPAEHETCAEHELELPNETRDATRMFDGQTFLRHQAKKATWSASAIPGVDVCDTGMTQATGGRWQLEVLRGSEGAASSTQRQEHPFRFLYLLRGSLELVVEGVRQSLAAGDALVLPKDVTFEWSSMNGATEVLDLAQLETS